MSHDLPGLGLPPPVRLEAWTSQPRSWTSRDGASSPLTVLSPHGPVQQRQTLHVVPQPQAAQPIQTQTVIGTERQVSSPGTTLTPVSSSSKVLQPFASEFLRRQSVSPPPSRSPVRQTTPAPVQLTGNESSNSLLSANSDSLKSRLSAPTSLGEETADGSTDKAKSKPPASSGVEAKFREIVEEQLVRLTSSLEAALEKRFEELESRLHDTQRTRQKGGSPARRAGEDVANAALSKAEEILLAFDANQDGHLGLDEMNQLQEAAGGSTLSPETYKLFCAEMAEDPSKGLGVNSLLQILTQKGTLDRDHVAARTKLDALGQNPKLAQADVLMEQMISRISAVEASAGQVVEEQSKRELEKLMHNAENARMKFQEIVEEMQTQLLNTSTEVEAKLLKSTKLAEEETSGVSERMKIELETLSQEVLQKSLADTKITIQRYTAAEISVLTQKSKEELEKLRQETPQSPAGHEELLEEARSVATAEAQKLLKALPVPPTPAKPDEFLFTRIGVLESDATKVQAELQEIRERFEVQLKAHRSQLSAFDQDLVPRVELLEKVQQLPDLTGSILAGETTVSKLRIDLSRQTESVSHLSKTLDLLRERIETAEQLMVESERLQIQTASSSKDAAKLGDRLKEASESSEDRIREEQGGLAELSAAHELALSTLERLGKCREERQALNEQAQQVGAKLQEEVEEAKKLPSEENLTRRPDIDSPEHQVRCEEQRARVALVRKALTLPNIEVHEERPMLPNHGAKSFSEFSPTQLVSLVRHAIDTDETGQLQRSRKSGGRS